jgi:hypothetical protein
MLPTTTTPALAATSQDRSEATIDRGAIGVATECGVIGLGVLCIGGAAAALGWPVNYDGMAVVAISTIALLWPSR